MSIKILTAATIAFAALTGAASAATLGNTQAGVGLFDQGGLYNQGINPHSTAQSDFGIDRTTVGSIGYTVVDPANELSRTGVPSDNPRNERGLGMFDIAR